MAVYIWHALCKNVQAQKCDLAVWPYLIIFALSAQEGCPDIAAAEIIPLELEAVSTAVRNLM